MVSSAISLSTVVLFLPLIGIIPLLLMREQGADGHSNENLKWTALGFSGAAFVASLVMWATFNASNPGLQFTQ